MKKIIILLTFFIAYAASSAQTVTKTYKVADFTAIVADGIPDVECVKDASQAGKIVVTATDIPLEDIKVSNDNGTLKVNSKRESNFSWFKNIFNDRKVKIVAYYAKYIDTAITKGTGDIKSNEFANPSGNVTLETYGTGDISAKSVIATNAKFTVTGTGDIEISSVKASTISALSSGTGDIEIDNAIKASEVNATVTGTGDIEISGSATAANFKATGTGNVNCGKLKASTVSLKATGTGDIYYNANAKVTASNGRKGLLHAVK